MAVANGRQGDILLVAARSLRGTLTRIYGWRRLRTLAITLFVVWLPLQAAWISEWEALAVRLVSIGLLALLAFGLFERWPNRLPGWLARWVLQVLAVAMVIPPAVLAFYVHSTSPGSPPFWEDGSRAVGFAMLTIVGILVGPWVALGALVRQKEALARHQALSFALERSELERRALDARLQLLQTQVQPHFLFNTLANIRVLVEGGSSQAPAVLDSLIAYLRAAVPRLGTAEASLGDELALVQAYLDLMRMRMPDRLSFNIDAAPDALPLFCPPMCVLTLVENAVRHGIDPAEDGGEISVEVARANGMCIIRVEDTGLGFQSDTSGLGTGLATLRERLALIFEGNAALSLEERPGGGVIASLIVPARSAVQ